jgi:glucan phosphoethanolaminetransferase (alkaline phosphatase superfamily)
VAGAFLVIVFFTLAIKKFSIRYAILLFLAFMGLVQQLHFSYYHTYLKPYEIWLFFEEQEEIWETVSEVYKYMLLPLLYFAIQAFLLYFIAKREYPLSFRYAWVVVALVLVAGPVVAHKRHDMYVFMPKNTSTSIANTYTTLSWFLGKELFKQKKSHHFKPYQVKEIKREALPQNIIVVMGESLSSKKMSLFGYEKETTPLLDKLKKDPHFLYTQGYSCGVCTKVSVPTFFTLKAEPTNPAPLTDNVTNLTRLAKEHGYHVYYITMQSSMLLSGYIAGFADKIVELKGYDEKLLEALNEIDFSQKNFIILHQRNAHSPYERYSPPKFHRFPYKGKPYKEYMLGSYLNSVLYTDYILASVFQKVRELNGSAVAFATSDHGELVGTPDDKGKFGHSMLDLEVAKVPLLAYYNAKTDPETAKIVQEVKNAKTHLDLGKIIAKVLGYEVIDPNLKCNECYINGTDLLGAEGYMKISKNPVKILKKY